jgi:hypothetical protein
MKSEAKSRGCRLDLSVSELRTLTEMAERDDSPTVADMVVGLRRALAMQIAKQDEARRNAADRRASRSTDDPTRRAAIVDGHNVTAKYGNFVDVGTSDYAAWTQLEIREALGTMPAQAPVRYNVWLVTVFMTQEQRDETDRLILGSDLTETDNIKEIEVVARSIISKET